MGQKMKPRTTTSSTTRQPKRYLGTRDDSGGLTVWVSDPNGSEAPLGHKKHQSICFECGYVGSGPADLALSMCSDAIGPEERELPLASGQLVGHQAWEAHAVVMERIVAKLDRAVDWEVPAAEVLHFAGRKARS